MMPKHEITRTDIMDRAAYAAIRAERRRAVTEMKKNRRISVGPDATFYFENFETMFHQVHEMLYIEKGGEDQIADELAAYNPMIPNGRELVTTIMCSHSSSFAPMTRRKSESPSSGSDRAAKKTGMPCPQRKSWTSPASP